jgi:hypothetical protein
MSPFAFLKTTSRVEVSASPRCISPSLSCACAECSNVYSYVCDIMYVYMHVCVHKYKCALHEHSVLQDIFYTYFQVALCKPAYLFVPKGARTRDIERLILRLHTSRACKPCSSCVLQFMCVAVHVCCSSCVLQFMCVRVREKECVYVLHSTYTTYIHPHACMCFMCTQPYRGRGIKPAIKSTR